MVIESHRSLRSQDEEIYDISKIDPKRQIQYELINTSSLDPMNSQTQQSHVISPLACNTRSRRPFRKTQTSRNRKQYSFGLTSRGQSFNFPTKTNNFLKSHVDTKGTSIKGNSFCYQNKTKNLLKTQVDMRGTTQSLENEASMVNKEQASIYMGQSDEQGSINNTNKCQKKILIDQIKRSRTTKNENEELELSTYLGVSQKSP